MPEPKAPTNKQSKSDFIRAQPVTMSAIEVVAKGKEKGIIFSESLVYKSRGRSKTKKGATKKGSKPSASAAAKTPAKIKSKADFVRARVHLSPKEIVEDAKTAGVKFDASYVYRVRAMDKTARKKKRAATKLASSMPISTSIVRASVTVPATTSSAEDLLRALAAELGLGRAVEILEGERARVQAMLKG
jgi:hypothetical protein